MFCSCRISTDKRVARSLCHSRATCSDGGSPVAYRYIVYVGRLLGIPKSIRGGLYCYAKFCRNRHSCFDNVKVTIFCASCLKTPKRQSRSIGMIQRTDKQKKGRLVVHSHTRCAGMGWAVLVTQCISIEAFIHWVTSPTHPILSRPSVCVNAPLWTETCDTSRVCWTHQRCRSAILIYCLCSILLKH